jgi:nitrogen regulatory protein PII
MQTHRAKRIEIIIETPALRTLLRTLEKTGVKGYSILPVMGGYGRSGSWSREGQVGIASSMVTVVCLITPERADSVLDAVFEVVERQIGIVTLSDAEVVRQERF